MDSFLRRWGRLFCWARGHKKPYEQKMSCEICPRCKSIVRYTGEISRRIYIDRGNE